MKLTSKLKQRFCKDNSIPINLFEEPYFTSRMELLNNQYNTLEKYEQFKQTLNKFDNEQDYFEAYNKLKDTIITYLSNQEAMQRFLAEDMNKYKATNEGFPKNDIYKQTFDGRYFISIDMRKANYTALRHYDKSIVGNTNTYEEFVGMFTEEEHFIQSKYIRQVVFGNLNPKRQVTYEKYLMDQVLTKVLKFTDRQNIVFFSTDEIVIDITDASTKSKLNEYTQLIDKVITESVAEGVNVRQETFLLLKIENTDGFLKQFINKEGREYKCLDSLTLPFVIRAHQGEPVQEEDKVFLYEGKLAKLLEIPNII